MSTLRNALRAIGPANAVSAALLAPAAFAQSLESTSVIEGRTLDCYVTDSSSDTVWRLADLNLDGDFQDTGEVFAFYDDAIGSLELGNNASIAVAANGVVFVADSTTDQIVTLVDLDGDGTAHAPGEHAVFFDGDPSVNGSGIAMESPLDVAVLRDGRVLVADANNGAGGADQILILDDIDGDGDANDAGEVTVFLLQPFFGSTGEYIPNAVDVLPDGTILYLEGGSTGSALPKGLYRLVDANADGTIDPFSEVLPYFIPPILGSTEFMWDFGIEADGTVYVADAGNDLIWRMRDDSGDGVIDNTSELSTYWTASGASFIWDVHPNERGQLLVAESQSPDRLVIMEDLDGSGSIDQPGEERVVYQDDVSPTNIVNPRGLTWRLAPTLVARGRGVLGSNVPYVVRGAVGEQVVLAGSIGAVATPMPLAPFGVLELDPASLFIADATVVAANGHAVSTFAIPNDPALGGQVLRLQALVGGLARRSLTERVFVGVN